MAVQQSLAPQLLCHLSRRLRDGDPISAVAQINEYLTANHPLRVAFTTRARQYLTPCALEHGSVQALLSGSLLGDLSEAQRQELKVLSCGENEQVMELRQALPTPKRRRMQQRRATNKPKFHAFRQKAMAHYDKRALRIGQVEERSVGFSNPR